MKIKADEVLHRPEVVNALRILYPTFSYCEACGLPWNCCTSKSVPITKQNNVFHTCQTCWDTLTLDELKAYCITSHNRWKHTSSIELLLECVEKEFKRTRGNEL